MLSTFGMKTAGTGRSQRSGTFTVDSTQPMQAAE